jgi:hypothetical protein
MVKLTKQEATQILIDNRIAKLKAFKQTPQGQKETWIETSIAYLEESFLPDGFICDLGWGWWASTPIPHSLHASGETGIGSCYYLIDNASKRIVEILTVSYIEELGGFVGATNSVAYIKMNAQQNNFPWIEGETDAILQAFFDIYHKENPDAEF